MGMVPEAMGGTGMGGGAVEGDEVDDVLDLTGNQLSEWDSIEPHLRGSLTRLELTLNRLTTLGCEGLAGVPNLVALGLRSNLISNEGFEALPAPAKAAFAASLRELVLYENQLVRELPPSVATFRALEHLDVSYNEVRSLEGVRGLTHLRELYAANNKIVEIVPGTGGRRAKASGEATEEGEGEGAGEGAGEATEESVGGVLADLTRLEVVELGSNRLRSCKGFGHLRGTLRELWLGRNKIVSAAPLRVLGGAGGALRRLSLASNRLTSVDGVEALVGLEELQLSHNGLTSLEGLETLTALRILDVAGNEVTRLPQQLAALVVLEDFWANDNKLENLEDVGPAFGATATLTTMYLERNPCAVPEQDTAEHAKYAAAVKALVPSLTQLDAVVLGPSSSSLSP